MLIKRFSLLLSNSQQAASMNWVSQNILESQKFYRWFALCNASALQKIKYLNQNKQLYFTCRFKWVTIYSVNFFGHKCFCTENSRPRDLQLICHHPTYTNKAQNALIDYFQHTSGLNILDAEHIGKNSPIYLEKLLRKVDKNEDGINKALSRFLRYNPPNEFELLFESIGLKPFDIKPLLPKLMFLKDDPKLLYNYHVLCNYGIDTKNMGKIYKEAIEVFRYENGLLTLKLQAYENIELSKTTIIKVVASSPSLLIGDISKDFIKFLEELKELGIERNWIGGVFNENESYHWNKMSILIHSCLDLGLTKQELGILIRKHPSILIDGSGKFFISLVVILLKILGTKKEAISLLKEFPRIEVKKFVNNLQQGLLLLTDIDMEPINVQKIIQSHIGFLGLNTLKKATSLLTELCIGKNRLCKIIEEDPDQLKNYIRGCKLKRLPTLVDYKKTSLAKREFLVGLGFVEDSKEMKRILKQCRGKGDELQERFNYLVKRGLDVNEVSDIIKRCPHILNQKIDVLDQKTDYLLNNLGVPLNMLVAFPQYLAFTIQRIKVRFLMYNWLKERGKVANVAVSSVLSCPAATFRQRYIDRHPKGHKMWEEFLKSSHSS